MGQQYFFLYCKRAMYINNCRFVFNTGGVILLQFSSLIVTVNMVFNYNFLHRGGSPGIYIQNVHKLININNTFVYNLGYKIGMYLHNIFNLQSSFHTFRPFRPSMIQLCLNRSLNTIHSLIYAVLCNILCVF